MKDNSEIFLLGYFNINIKEKKRNYVKEDFHARLLDYDWVKIYRERDPNICWDTLETRIRNELSRFCLG